MALQMETYLSGRMHNVVFFKRAGTYMAGALPGTVQLSPATKVCNSNFGIASACGKTPIGASNSFAFVGITSQNKKINLSMHAAVVSLTNSRSQGN